MTTLTRTFPDPAAQTHAPSSARAVRWRRAVMELLAAAAAMSLDKMSFLEHLDELRRRIIWSLVFVAVAFAGCWMFADDLYDIASAPIRANAAVTLSVARPQDIVALYIKVTLVTAIFLSAPFVMAQAWMFVSPGLYPRERRYAVPFVLLASGLFLAGGAFGYFVAFPAALQFLLEWIVQSRLTPIIDAGEYFNLFFTIIVALGITFQIPAVVFVLSGIGLVNARLLLRHLNAAVVGCLVVAAVITPTSDPWNMLLIAGPMIVLYVVGIGVAWLCGRRRAIDQDGLFNPAEGGTRPQ
jgi:sec-independent protein translocase protein TatC